MLTQTSVSQLEVFDPAQYGGCQRRYWFEREMGLKPEQTKAASTGEAGHALLATHLSTGALPPKKALMGKAVTGAILKGELTKPGADLFVEQRFDRQAKFSEVCECSHRAHEHSDTACTVVAGCDENGVPVTCGCEEWRPKWNPLDVEKTLWLGGVPLDGFIDLSYRRAAVPHVLDHKFKADWDDGRRKSGKQLIHTIQMPVYALSEMRRWPDATSWRLTHHYVSKRGVLSEMATHVFPAAAILDRKAEIEALIEQMKVVSTANDQDDVPFNRKSCEAWNGCPHQAHCNAFKENKMLDQAEMEALGEVAAPASGTAESLFDEDPAPPVAPAVAPAVEDDEEAKLEAEFAAKKAALTASKTAKRRLFNVEPDAPAAPPQQTAPPKPEPVKIEGFCTACGAQLSADNASKLQGGAIKHIDCPKAQLAAPKMEEKPKAAKAPKVDKPSPAAPKADATPAAPPVIPNADPKKPAEPEKPALSAAQLAAKENLELWMSIGTTIAETNFPGKLCGIVAKMLGKINEQVAAAQVANAQAK